jgi:hypothetical protein
VVPNARWFDGTLVSALAVAAWALDPEREDYLTAEPQEVGGLRLVCTNATGERHFTVDAGSLVVRSESGLSAYSPAEFAAAFPGA